MATSIEKVDKHFKDFVKLIKSVSDEEDEDGNLDEMMSKYENIDVRMFLMLLQIQYMNVSVETAKELMLEEMLTTLSKFIPEFYDCETSEEKKELLKEGFGEEKYDKFINYIQMFIKISKIIKIDI